MSIPISVESGVEFLGYRAEEEIGRGGMGVVYRAQDLRLRRTVALKVMAPELALDKRFRERFARESELAMALEHPNVVPIHDAGEFEGRLYLAMRLVEGSDLRRVLRAEGRLEPARSIAICRQVAEALDAAHAKGLVHRDVKPSNVLLDERGHVYLADFGLTRRLSEHGAPFADSRSLGTPAYLAPEQVEGSPVDGRADVYSLGCLLYECLTGTPPFSAGSRLGVMWAHLEEEPPRATEAHPELPAALDAVVAKTMAKAPEDRHTTCTELVREAEAALGLGAAASTRPRRIALVAAFAALVALAAGAVLALARYGDEPASVAPVVRRDTLVRIDPKTNVVARVTAVGGSPAATAVAGDTIWVYTRLDSTVSEIDAPTGRTRYRMLITTPPLAVGPRVGPVLAADSRGAWLVGHDFSSGKSVVTRLTKGGGKRNHEVGGDARAVVVAQGAAWVLVGAATGNSAVRLNLRSGRMERRIRLPENSSSAAVDGLAVGARSLWVTESESALLHRLDLATGSVRSADLGMIATPPVLRFGWLWLCASRDGSNAQMLRMNPRTVRSSLSRNAMPAESGRFAVGHGSIWRYDIPSGTVMRYDARTGAPAGIVRVLSPDDAEALIVTSLASDADSIWATVGVDDR